MKATIDSFRQKKRRVKNERRAKEGKKGKSDPPRVNVAVLSEHVKTRAKSKAKKRQSMPNPNPGMFDAPSESLGLDRPTVAVSRTESLPRIVEGQKNK